jgi:hypothetical protein
VRPSSKFQALAMISDQNGSFSLKIGLILEFLREPSLMLCSSSLVYSSFGANVIECADQFVQISCVPIVE